MINLLPKKEKGYLRQERIFKLILILGIVFLTALICFSLVLLSIRIHLSGETASQKIFLEQKKLESQNLKVLEKEIESHNLTLSKLNFFYQETFKKVEILEKISKILPSKTYLTNLTFATTTKEKETLLSVSISGFSPTRQLLLELKKNVEKEKLFEEIYFPPSNWVKATDIDFTVNFKIKTK